MLVVDPGDRYDDPDAAGALALPVDAAANLLVAGVCPRQCGEHEGVAAGLESVDTGPDRGGPDQHIRVVAIDPVEAVFCWPVNSPTLRPAPTRACRSIPTIRLTNWVYAKITDGADTNTPVRSSHRGVVSGSVD